METKKASDYLYDLGLGLEPKTDELIIEAINNFHKDKMSSLLADLKIKEIAHLTFMRDNLLDTAKADDIKYVSAQKEIISDLITKLQS